MSILEFIYNKSMFRKCKYFVTIICVCVTMMILNYSFLATQNWYRVKQTRSSLLNGAVNRIDTDTSETRMYVNDKDDDVSKMIEVLKDTKNNVIPVGFWDISFNDLVRKLYKEGKRKLARHPSEFDNTLRNESAPNWQKFQQNIRQYSLYDMDDPVIDQLLHDMVTLPIVNADDRISGTMFKVVLTFSDGGKALFKPLRFPHEVDEDPNHDQLRTHERHVSEIASFNLDRILGFNKVPPTTGRLVNLNTEVLPTVQERTSRTFFTSETGNTCFYGECMVYCDKEHAFCGNKEVIEGSVMTFLPSDVRLTHPANKFYHFSSCDTVRQEYPFDNDKFVLELIDVHIFDFLTGNRDRHNYDTIKEFGNDTFMIMTDNGKGFGRSNYDDMLTLAPLRQCCRIRRSTLLKYIKLYTGSERLSALLEKSMENDHVAPVLTKSHLNAVDRRVYKILQVVSECLKYINAREVIVPDN